MVNGNTSFLLILAGVVGYLYLLLPLRIKKNLWINPNLSPWNDPPAVEDWPAVSEFFANTEQFESFGYQKEEVVVFSEMTPNSIVFFQPFRNFDDVSVGALAITLSKVNNAWRVVDRKIAFQTFFSDESSIASGFAASQDIVGPTAGNEVFPVPWTQDVGELLSIHQRLIGNLAGRKVKLDMVGEKYDGDISAMLVKRTSAEWKRYSGTKYFYLEEARKTPTSVSAQTPINPYAAPTASPLGDRILLTYRGAYRMTWGILFPVKQILRWKSGRKTKRILRQCKGI